MPIIAVPEFAPDEPDVPSATSDTVFNVVPLSNVSYGPQKTHVPLSTAITNRCQGALSISDTSGNVKLYAGDSTKLYRTGVPGTTLADVSKVGGYVTGSQANWNFTIYKNRVIATNGTDAPQSFVEGTSSVFADLITTGVTGLKAKYCAIVRNFLMLGYTSDPADGTQSQRAWWGKLDDPSTFPTPGTQAAANALSDYQDMTGTHGEMRGILGNLGAADGAFFFERGVWRAVYSGLPDIFDFVPAEGARGLLASGGLNQYGARCAYPTEDGFYMFDGSNSAPIGKQKIDRFFTNDLQSNYLDRISSCSDQARGLMVWAYPGVGSVNGNPNRLLFYSEPFGRWTVTEANAVQIEYLMRGAIFGTTLEQLDAFGTIDSLPFSLDAQQLQNNRSVLAAFDTSHRYGYFNGVNLPATVSTSDFEPRQGSQTKVTRVRPLIDSKAATVASAGRDAISDAVVYGKEKRQEPNGSCSVNSRGRYHRTRVKTQLGDNWTQISGFDVESGAPVGKR